MYKIIFFDTETTGNTDKDFLCQLAYKTSNESFEGLYKPPGKIPPEASAVHHISNKMVEGKLPFSESPDLAKIKKLFEDKNSVAVAHNAVFDAQKRRRCSLQIHLHAPSRPPFGQ